MPIELVTFPDVEIMAEGTYPCETGIHTFTREDLESAVAAVSSDPAIKDPRLKLGHVGEHGELNVGMPVFGRYQNLHIVEASDGRAKLYGDVVGVPAWFAQIMPTAYPNRSIEGKWNVRTSTGKEHQFVIQAVSCLGVDLPAIDNLEDLKIVYEEGPDGLKSEVVAQFAGDVPTKITTNRATARNNPKEDQGMTPEEIKRLRALSGLTEEQLPDDASEEQRKAAYDAIDARVSKPEGKPEEGKTEEGKTEEKPEVKSEEKPEVKPEEGKTEEKTEPVAASEGVTFDKATAAQLREDAKLGREARDEQVKARRHGIVEAAIEVGKIPPARREHYRGLMERDEAGTTEFLGGLEENVIPVSAREMGSNNDSESAVAQKHEQAIEQGMRSWFPELSDDKKKETV